VIVSVFQCGIAFNLRPTLAYTHATAGWMAHTLSHTHTRTIRTISFWFLENLASWSQRKTLQKSIFQLLRERHTEIVGRRRRKTKTQLKVGLESVAAGVLGKKS